MILVGHINEILLSTLYYFKYFDPINYTLKVEPLIFLYSYLLRHFLIRRIQNNTKKN